MKSSLDFPRPIIAMGSDTVTILGDPETSGAFPSGHAAFAVLVAASLMPGASRATQLALGVGAILVCLSRVWVGAHFPADVVGGALISIACVSRHSHRDREASRVVHFQSDLDTPTSRARAGDHPRGVCRHDGRDGVARACGRFAFRTLVLGHRASSGWRAGLHRSPGGRLGWRARGGRTGERGSLAPSRPGGHEPGQRRIDARLALLHLRPAADRDAACNIARDSSGRRTSRC